MYKKKTSMCRWIAGKNLMVYWAVGLLLMDFSSHFLQKKKMEQVIENALGFCVFQHRHVTIHNVILSTYKPALKIYYKLHGSFSKYILLTLIKCPHGLRSKIL